MFRPDAGLGLRIARTVLLPFGPLIVLVVVSSVGAHPHSDPHGEGAAKVLFLVGFAWFFCALVLVPALLFRNASPPDPPAADDGGENDVPPTPPAREPGPSGIPLPDAEQSRERIRDHVRAERRWLRRRTAREPEPAPRTQAQPRRV